MAEFFSSGHSIDLVLFLIGLEAIGLMVLWRMGRCPVPPLATLLILAPGSCLLVAARAALTGAAWGWVSFFLLVALAIHLVDLRQRWQHWNRLGSAEGLRGK
ncbi:hypothetical protein [uncultured Thiodictyon sp.]|uniref:hypothetical protein n=1 Tax=uncultured Thiodictyon sp. TaxID=1846217 RepID=UPI0025DFAC81|nr:hypothetical protein [uncultured Thiodictyon sp.]